MVHSALYQFLIIVWSLAATVKCFETFILFEGFRGLYVLISESIRDSIRFVVVLAYICLAFAFIGRLMEMGVIIDPRN